MRRSVALSALAVAVAVTGAAAPVAAHNLATTTGHYIYIYRYAYIYVYMYVNQRRVTLANRLFNNDQREFNDSFGQKAFDGSARAVATFEFEVAQTAFQSCFPHTVANVTA